MNEYLIKALKEGRARKGLKQSDVAALLGVKGGTLSNYENGISEPDIDTFAMLCEIYDLDFAFVLSEAYGLSVQGEDFKIRPSEMEVAKKYRDLDSHGKEMVDFTLLKEWERSTAEQKTIPMTVREDTTYHINAAHPIEGVSEEDKQFDEDIMNDENF